MVSGDCEALQVPTEDKLFDLVGENFASFQARPRADARDKLGYLAVREPKVLYLHGFDLGRSGLLASTRHIATLGPPRARGMATVQSTSFFVVE